MFNKSIFISSLITICLCIIPHCFANNSKNLDELITYAMANNILVKNANSKVEIAKQELIIAKSEYLPELNLKSWGYDDQNYGTNIGLKQNIYDAGKTDNKVEIATLELQYQQQQLNLVKNNLKQNIIQNYLDCQKYYELEYSYKQIRNNLSLLIKQLRKYSKTGQINKIDLLLIDTDFKEIKTELVLTKQKHLESIDNLNFTIGNFNKNKFQCNVKDNYLKRFFNLSSILYQAILQKAENNNPEIALIKIKQKKQNLENKNNILQYKPEINLEAGAGHWEDEDKSANLYVGISFQMPIFTGFAASAEKNKAKNLNSIQKQSLSLNKNNIINKLHIAYQKYHKYKEIQPIFKQRLLQSTKTLTMSKKRYLKNLGNIDHWQMSYQSWVKNKNAFINFKYEEAKQLLNLAYYVNYQK